MLSKSYLCWMIIKLFVEKNKEDDVSNIMIKMSKQTILLKSANITVKDIIWF